MISDRLIALVRCPDCRGRIVRSVDTADGLRCQTCGRTYRAPSGEYWICGRRTSSPSRPSTWTKRSTPTRGTSGCRHRSSARRFATTCCATFSARARRPRGRSRLRQRSHAALEPRPRARETVGIDISPFFSGDARRGVPLLLGDLRRLPFADGTFTKAWSLDVLEHLSPDALGGMLTEANRVLAPGGALFVYTHVRKNARVAAGLRWINRARSRARTPRADRHASGTAAQVRSPQPARRRARPRARRARCGFRIARITFYTPIVGGFVENILMRMAERAMAKRAARRIDPGVRAADMDAQAIREARSAAKEQIARSPATYGVLRALSFAMKLDLLLFGRITSGPFFALLVKRKAQGRARLGKSECGFLEPEPEPANEDSLLRHRPDRSRHDGRIGSCHRGGRRTRGARARGPRARRTGRRAVSLRAPLEPGPLDSDGAAVWREATAVDAHRRGPAHRRPALQPAVVMERYYNFGGEGMLAASAAGARTVLEVNAPVIDHAGSPKGRIDRRAHRRAHAPVAREHMRARGPHRDAERRDPPQGHPVAEDRAARVGRRYGPVPPGRSWRPAVRTAGDDRRDLRGRVQALARRRDTWCARCASSTPEAARMSAPCSSATARNCRPCRTKPPVFRTSSSPAPCRTRTCPRAWPRPTSASLRSRSAPTGRCRSGSTGPRSRFSSTWPQVSPSSHRPSIGYRHLWPTAARASCTTPRSPEPWPRRWSH